MSQDYTLLLEPLLLRLASDIDLLPSIATEVDALLSGADKTVKVVVHDGLDSLLCMVIPHLSDTSLAKIGYITPTVAWTMFVRNPSLRTYKFVRLDMHRALDVAVQYWRDIRHLFATEQQRHLHYADVLRHFIYNMTILRSLRCDVGWSEAPILQVERAASKNV